MSVTLRRCRRALAALAVLGACTLLFGSRGFARGGLNFVKIKGLVGVKNAPGSLAQMVLDLDGKLLDFSVLDIRRTRGAGEGRSLIDKLGLGVAPQLRVIGPSDLLQQITAAAPGTRLSLHGLLSYQPPYYQVTSLGEGGKEDAGKGSTPKAKGK